MTAQRLWLDPRLVEVPARTKGEARWVCIGVIDGVHWSAVIARRKDRIRIISVRRSRPEKVAHHEGS